MVIHHWLWLVIPITDSFNHWRYHNKFQLHFRHKNKFINRQGHVSLQSEPVGPPKGAKRPLFCLFSTAKPPFSLQTKIVPCTCNTTFPWSTSASRKGRVFRRKLENKRRKSKTSWKHSGSPFTQLQHFVFKIRLELKEDIWWPGYALSYDFCV